jgi:hypothetical protein
MVVNLAVSEQTEESFHFVVVDSAAEADSVDVAHRYQNGRIIRNDSEVVEPAGRPEDGFVFDAFDDSETMIRVNDLVADLKCHGSPCLERVWKAESRASSAVSIAESWPEFNEKRPKTLAFSRLSPSFVTRLRSALSDSVPTGWV